MAFCRKREKARSGNTRGRQDAAGSGSAAPNSERRSAAAESCGAWRTALRRGTTVTVERDSARRRQAAEALIDGYPGLARRLKLADEATRTLLGDDNRRIVALTQAAARIERDPSTLVAELTAVREGFPALDGILTTHADHWRQIESVNPLDPPLSSAAIESARRTLATTHSQFLA